jgi:3-methyladenine DNA glycosylase AlkD
VLNELRKDLKRLANPDKAKISQGFFKTAVGQYGEGDIFLGISVPAQRTVALKYKDLSLEDIEQLLKSKIHEERLTSVMILVYKFLDGDEDLKKQIFDFYLKNAQFVNNWDLVDASADKIVGAHLFDKDKNILLKLANSKNLWEKRIAIVSTYYFIRKKQSEYTFKIAEILLKDPHDLIQKAVGWMLREVGKNVSQEVEEEFLKRHYKVMPRTMLRYSIERFPKNLKIFYMLRS